MHEYFDKIINRADSFGHDGNLANKVSVIKNPINILRKMRSTTNGGSGRKRVSICNKRWANAPAFGKSV